MKLKHLLAAAALAAAMALPAQAAIGEANITPDTSMAELRANPSVVGAGLYTYNQEQDSPGTSAGGPTPLCGSTSTTPPHRTAPQGSTA